MLLGLGWVGLDGCVAVQIGFKDYIANQQKLKLKVLSGLFHSWPCLYDFVLLFALTYLPFLHKLEI